MRVSLSCSVLYFVFVWTWKDVFWNIFTSLRRAIKMNLANEGLEAQKQEAETLAKKRKAEEDKLWEGSSFVFSACWRPLPSLSFLRYRNARGKSGKLAQLRLDQKEKEGQDNQYPRLTSHSFLLLCFSPFSCI